MAKGQQPGGGAVTLWMIVFAALWLVSTVVLVILYTGQEELRTENERLLNDKARIVSDAESRSLELFKSARPGSTLVGLLEQSRADTAQWATGDPKDDPAAVRTKLGELLRMIQNDRLLASANSFADVSYHQALSRLYGDFKGEHAARQEAEERSQQLATEVEGLTQAAGQQKEEFDRRAKKLADQLADIEAQRTKAREDASQTVEKLEREFEQRRRQTEDDLTKERQASAALRDQVGKLEERIASLQDRFADLLPGPKKLAAARQADGRVLKAIPGDDVVYINRGRKHKITLGLRFAVYSADKGIPIDGRSKAQIEVVSLFDESAECKINRIDGGEVILEDDPIANPIYDENRPVRFVVVGEFDLDHDDRMDPRGGAAIESMIADWGGTVTIELTALTDFVVLGAAPPKPRAGRDNPGGGLDARLQTMQQRYDHYVDTRDAANSLAVAVLGQEAFLNFLGYTDRLAGR